ncbi:MAG: 6-bladed beta-propeller, partial [Candidatus Delongbacteria bacterium]|nr:6-bladed beta-propeller [Candidatus Delongbacteria bacterium]
MKMKLRMMIFIFFVFVFFGCTKDKSYSIMKGDKGIVNYMNYDVNSKKDLGICFEKILTIKGVNSNENNSKSNFYVPFSLNVDRYNNIYILDRKTATIKKFMSNGKFIVSFGQKGEGPGEFQDPIDMTIMKDTVFV